MPGSLSTYRSKRDFGATREPRGKVPRRAAGRLAFVVQKHAARRLHYDFRLELDGVLKSWAIPKGPSLDPKVKRMAVATEDHPLEYADFEGVIPKGEYGAGTVEVWDRGRWAPVGDAREGLRKGRLKLELFGEKLTGRWNLVRMRARPGERQASWLLFKEDDASARAASQYEVTEQAPGSVLGKPAARLPPTLAPQLATLAAEPPRGAGWICEVKLDGYRVLARIDGEDVRLFTRNGHDWSAKMPGLVAALRELALGTAWLDGEIVVMDERGNPSFQALQRAFDARVSAEVVYFVFDLPFHGGRDLRELPLLERRRALQALLAGREGEAVRLSQAFDAPVADLLASACAQGLEGLIAKRADAPYVSRRSGDWLKLKCTQRQEFVVAGWTDPKGSRTGFGSLLLGVHDAQGRLVYAGSVGTGFDDATLRAVKAKLDALATAKPPFEPVPRGVKGHWVRPKLVAEVAFTEWTGDGRIRHPAFQGLRADKEPRAVTREAAAAPKPVKAAAARRVAKSRAAAPAIKVTHPERVIDPASGATKLDLVSYYAAVAEHMLPHLAGRPVALVRAPSGVSGQHFFQKHGEKIGIPGIRHLDRRYWPGHAPMLEIASAEALVGAAQMNVVELHTWNSTTADIAHPDRVIFDLDPGEGVDWVTLREAARLTHRALELLGLASFLKTSGGKGLHVVVPLSPAPRWTYERVKDFSGRLVRHMAKTLPQLFVAKSGASNRVGRIFIDYLRNGRGATTVAAFSARARPGLGVSMPLAWGELARLEAADQWTIANAPARLARRRADPWKDYAATRQTLDEAAERLG